MRNILILITLCCYLAITYAQSDLESIHRNAHFQYNLATIALKNQIFGAENVELGLAKTDQQRECIKNVKAENEEDNKLLDETVGEILPEVDRLYENGTEKEIKTFLEKTDYPAYKKTKMEEFKKRLMTWVPEVQSKMADCRK